MTFSLLRATPSDIAECVTLRGRTRENAVSEQRLREVGITAASWGDDVRRGELVGHVCRDADGTMAGYCFGHVPSGEVVVLALLPAFESRGLGRRLLALVAHDLQRHGHHRLFLGCSANPQHRSHGFYRHLGWRSTGTVDDRGDEVLEWAPPP